MFAGVQKSQYSLLLVSFWRLVCSAEFLPLYTGSTKTSTKYGHWSLDKNEEVPNVFEIRKRTEEGKVEPRLLSMARLSYRLK